MLDQQTPVEDALILIVDDEPVNLAILESLLRRDGFRRIACVTDAVAALAVVAETPPSCILLDVVMPGMDGLEMCRRLRADDRHARTPVIIQTALTSREERQAAFAAGASDVLAKPVDPGELAARVRVHVAGSLLSDGLFAYRSRMEAELDEARALVETVLPQDEALAECARRGVVLSHTFRPSSALGGDYWNCWAVGDGRLGLLVGDVSGHGAAAALRMFALHTLVTPPPPFSADPLAMAAHLDSRLHTFGHKQAQYVAAAYGVIDVAGGVFRYVGAGLRDGAVWRRDGRLTPIALSGLPLGLATGVPRRLREVPLEPGDTLVLYSDALVECRDLDGAPRNEAELRVWLARQLAEDPPRDQLGAWLGERFLAAFGDGVDDDLLIVSAWMAAGSSTRDR